MPGSFIGNPRNLPHTFGSFIELRFKNRPSRPSTIFKSTGNILVNNCIKSVDLIKSINSFISSIDSNFLCFFKRLTALSTLTIFHKVFFLLTTLPWPNVQPVDPRFPETKKPAGIIWAATTWIIATLLTVPKPKRPTSLSRINLKKISQLIYY